MSIESTSPNGVTVHLNAIATAVPDRDIHQAFVDWAAAQLDAREEPLFRRMVGRSGIDHRWSIHSAPPTGKGGFYADSHQPPTSARMALYAEAAPALALRAVAGLSFAPEEITHLIVASCTGFIAPGIDQIIARHIGLDPTVERLMIGFMGCYAAITALRSARHIVRSSPSARVLVIAVELSTLHLALEHRIEPLLAMLQFGDGAAAALVSARPGGIAMDDGFSIAVPDSGELIRWVIGDYGFAMDLSGEVPARIAAATADPGICKAMLGDHAVGDVVHWAVHAGGRSVLDAVEHGLELPKAALDDSRAILREYGNVSSATLMFVLQRMIAKDAQGPGVAIAFGPGLAIEGFRFGVSA